MERYNENKNIKGREMSAISQQENTMTALQKIQELHIKQVYKLEKQNLVSVERFADFIQQIKNEADLSANTFKYNLETINSILNYLNDVPDNSDSFAALYEDLTQGYNSRDLIMILNGYLVYTYKNEKEIKEKYIQSLNTPEMNQGLVNQKPKIDNVIQFKRPLKSQVLTPASYEELQKGITKQKPNINIDDKSLAA